MTPLSSRPSPRDSNKYPCSYVDCKKSFNRPVRLAQHLRSHTNTRPFVCHYESCTKDFLRESHLKHHIKSQHSDVRDYVCEWDGCRKSFVTGTRLRRHIAAHEGKEQFRCGVANCGRFFRKHGTLQKHITIAHEGKFPFICEVPNERGEGCGAGFDTVGKLKAHKGRIHGGKRFWCTVCGSGSQAAAGDLAREDEGAGFATYTELQAHIGDEHPPTCEECGFQSKSQRALKSHIDISHSPLGVDERRKFACPEPGCDRGFTKRGNLNVHIQAVHRGKKYVCGGFDLSLLHKISGWDGSGACGQALTSKATLEEHIRTAHLGLQYSRKIKKKPSCNIDPHRMPTISSLIRLTGSGYEKESGRGIACLLSRCDYRFIRPYDLEIHLNFHHGLSDHEIESIFSAKESLTKRPSLDGSLVFATAQDLEDERALDKRFENNDGMDRMSDIQNTVSEDILASGDLGVDLSKQNAEEAHTGADRGGDVEMIDPALRNA